MMREPMRGESTHARALHAHARTICARKELAASKCNGVVAPEYVSHAELPSAPLRAFSYTQAGGATSCGQRPNAVFKCPDGYSGSFPLKLPRMGGYPEFENRQANPFSNKVPRPQPQPQP